MKVVAAPGCMLLFAWVTAQGCASVSPYRASIGSDDANERILGIRAAGEARDGGAVPLLVDRLEDEDSGVRFFAIIALEKITGERFGYNYADSSLERSESVLRWRSFVKRGEHLTSAGGGQATAGGGRGDSTGL